jgi:multidrug resistance efflux pump
MRKAFRLRNLSLLLGGLILTACAASAAQTSSEETAADLTASGFLEAEEIHVAAETSGRVAEVMVDESDQVQAGNVVVRLDDALLQADRAQAAAAVSVARANLARLRAGATPEELAAAEAAVNEANAALKGVQGAAGSAWAAAGNPQSIDVQIAAADTQANLALRQIDLAKVQLEEARIKLGWLQSISGDDRDENAIEFQQYEVQILEANVRAAEAQYLGAQQKLDLLNEQRGRPLSALAQAHAAQSRVSIAQAQIELAEAKFDLVKNGALLEEIRIAEAQVAAAQSQVDLIAAKIAQLTLIAPIDGIVATRSIQVGETAAQNVPLLTISDLSALKLVVYIPDPQIGLVHLGAPVSISVDSEPGKTFEGVVTLISRQAEFTPRNVQTEEDRVSLVFAVEIVIDNTNGVLKPGMPADATITVPRP